MIEGQIRRRRQPDSSFDQAGPATLVVPADPASEPPRRPDRRRYGPTGRTPRQGHSPEPAPATTARTPARTRTRPRTRTRARPPPTGNRPRPGTIARHSGGPDHAGPGQQGPRAPRRRTRPTRRPGTRGMDAERRDLRPADRTPQLKGVVVQGFTGFFDAVPSRLHFRTGWAWAYRGHPWPVAKETTKAGDHPPETPPTEQPNRPGRSAPPGQPLHSGRS